MNSNSILKLILVTSLASVSIFVGGCSKSDDAESHLQRAHDHIDKSEFAAAEIELKNVLQSDSSNAEAIAAMSKIYVAQGRFRNAYPFLSALKSIVPNDIDSRNSLAQIELAAGLREQARESANFVLSIDPKNQEAPLLLADTADNMATLAIIFKTISALPESPGQLVALGSIALKKSDATTAKKHFEAAIKLDPSFPSAYSGLFAIHLVEGNKGAAEAALKKSAELSETRSGAKMRYVHYLLQKPDRKAATAYLANMVENAHDYLPALSLYAEQVAQNKNLEKAKVLINQAIRLDPIDPIAMRLQGTLLILDQKLDEAIEQLKKMLELYPNDLKANYQIALAYLGKNDLARAESKLGTIVAAAPRHLEATVLLSSLQVRKEDYSGAIVTLKNYIQHIPNSAEALLLLADVYNRQGNSDEAIQIYQSLDEALPDNPQLDYLSGLSQLKQQDRSRARESFEAALTDNAIHLQSVEQLTALDLGERNYDDALSRINRTIELSPEMGVLYVIRGQIQTSMGDTVPAKQSFEKALQIEPENRSAHILLSRQALASGNSDAALNQLNTLLQTNPNDIGALTTTAGIHEKSGNTNKAKAIYEQILEINNNYLPALNNLAYLYSSENEQSDKAFEYAKKARELAPDDPYAADTLGWIVYKRKEYTWALSLLQESGARLSEHPEVAYHLGAVQYTLGNTQEALRNLEKAVNSEVEYIGISHARSSLRILEIDTNYASDSDIALLETSISSGINDPYAYTILATIQLHSKDFSLAEKNFRSALDISPGNVAAKSGLALALAEQGNNDEAMTLAREATRQAPNNLQAIYAQGQVAYLTGDHTWAVSLFRDIARRDSSNNSVQENLTHALLSVGEVEAAIEAANQALSLSENETIANLRSQLIYIQAPSAATKPLMMNNDDSLGTQLSNAIESFDDGDLSNAQSKFETILESYSEQIQAKLGLANILAKKPENAERVFKLAGEVRAALPDNAESKALQGIARYQQNQYNQAKQAFAGIRDQQWSDPVWEFHYGLTLKETGDDEAAQKRLENAISNGLSSEHLQQAEAAIADIQFR